MPGQAPRTCVWGRADISGVNLGGRAASPVPICRSGRRQPSQIPSCEHEPLRPPEGSRHTELEFLKLPEAPDAQNPSFGSLRRLALELLRPQTLRTRASEASRNTQTLRTRVFEASKRPTMLRTRVLEGPTRVRGTGAWAGSSPMDIILGGRSGPPVHIWAGAPLSRIAYLV